jgi:hypothetical protein
MNVYLVGAVDHATPESHEWKEVLGDLLSKVSMQSTLYDPYKPWNLCGQLVHDQDRARYIERVNTAALNASDAIVAWLPKSTFTMGSPIEVDQAHSQHKLVIVVTDIGYGANLYLLNRVSRNQYIYYSSKEALTGIMKQVVTQLEQYESRNSSIRKVAMVDE